MYQKLKKLFCRISLDVTSKFAAFPQNKIDHHIKENKANNITCPNCGNLKFYEGPSGGIATNVKCVGCGLWFNHTPFGLELIGIKPLIGEHKKIVWYCPQCKVVNPVIDEHKYPTCHCGNPLKVCWSYKGFPREYCETCSDRFTCYTEGAYV